MFWFPGNSGREKSQCFRNVCQERVLEHLPQKVNGAETAALDVQLYLCTFCRMSQTKGFCHVCYKTALCGDLRDSC